YKEIALKLGEHKIMSKEFAETKLVEMAKYRNRLVHFYAEISAEELYQIIQKNLGDFDIFLSHIKSLLTNPAKFGMSAE
ncbi:MAG: HepT-like ribonuclease domain-containing protein, partial [Patescibacteria group bacterium]